MHIKKVLTIVLFVAVCLLIFNGNTMGSTEGVFQLYPGESRVLDIAGLTQAAIGNDSIADIRVLSSDEILLNGLSQGQTSLIIWKGQERMDYKVFVKEIEDKGLSDDDKRALSAKIHASIRQPGVNVRFIEESAVLEGYVRNYEIFSWAEQVARLYVDNVINHISVDEGKKRIKIDAQIIEITRDLSSKLGIASIEEAIKEGIVANSGVFLSNLSLAIQKGEGRILSEPSIIVYEGQEAELLVGGEIPIPLSQEESGNVEWKNYGVKVTIVPNIEENGAIIATVSSEVSSLDWSNRVTTGGVDIPAFRVRRANTTVQTYPGDLLVLGGLIQVDEVKHINKLPILGDIPILGELFKHTDIKENRTELIMTINIEVM